MTNQGGGGDAAGTSPTQVRTDSAAAASFEERVNSVIESAAGDWRWFAARYLRAGDEVKALNARGVEMAALVSMKDDALAAKDAEIARLTKERDEANAAAVRYADASAYKHMSNADLGLQVEGLKRDLSAVTADRDALKDALNPKRTDAKDCLGYAALSDGLEIAQGFGDCVCEVDEYADKPNCDQGGET